MLKYLTLILLPAAIWADSLTIPPAGWEAEPSPLASDWAEPGGRMKAFASQYPKSFNYYLDRNVFSSQLFGHQFESLIGQNALTLQPEPALAEKVTVSDDKMTFTFYLHPDAKWSDGKPITAEDVIWTYEAVMNPDNITGAHKVGLGRFEAPVALDERTVQFKAKELHWSNIWSAGGFNILPKHWWEKQEDFNTVNFEFPVVSGPFKVKSLKEPHSILLERREDYWAADDPRNEGLGNFDEIEYFFYGDRENAWENFLRGNFDFFAVYTARRWATQTDGERFDKNWIVKQGVHNYNAVGFQGFAMNMRRKPYDDLNVRKALAHLLDRERMNRTLTYNQYALTASFFPDIYPEGNPNALVDFNVDKARDLLKEAGWAVNEQGRLEKDGMPLKIKFLTRSVDSDKFLLIYKEALDQVGIDLEIDRRDWSAWAKALDEFDYDMTWAAWGAGVFKDPEAMWHSKFIDQKSGINITGFQDPEVDKLIDSIKGEFDVEKRHAVVKKIDAILVANQPYVLLWHIDYTRLLYWNKFGTPDHVLGKYGSESSSEGYWWLDPDLEADLEAAREDGEKLPSRPVDVYFNKVFQGEGATAPQR